VAPLTAGPTVRPQSPTEEMWGSMFTLRRSFLRVLLATGVCAALLALPATAFGQDALSNPTAAQYEPNSQVQGTSTNGSNGPTGSAGSAAANTTNSTAGASGTLPFTGFDAIVVAGAALTLIAAGFVLRRLSAPRPPGA
jgi:hypothetical protein